MSTSVPPEEPQIPKSSGGLPFIIGAAALAAVGGVAFWLTREEPKPPAPPPEPAPPASAPAAPPTQAILDSIPPPPPVEEVEEPDAGAQKAANGPSKTVDLCGGPCKGTASAALTSALTQRAASSRTCYERALRTNEHLQGKMVVQVRVDANGRVCSARIAEDGVGSQEVSSCVLASFRGAKLPAPTGGCLDVNVPMSFVPRGGK